MSLKIEYFFEACCSVLMRSSDLPFGIVQSVRSSIVLRSLEKMEERFSLPGIF